MYKLIGLDGKPPAALRPGRPGKAPRVGGGEGRAALLPRPRLPAPGPVPGDCWGDGGETRQAKLGALLQAPLSALDLVKGILQCVGVIHSCLLPGRWFPVLALEASAGTKHVASGRPSPNCGRGIRGSWQPRPASTLSSCWWPLGLVSQHCPATEGFLP